MDVLFMGHDEVKENLPIKELLECLEKAFVHYSQKSSGLIQPQRMFLNVSQNKDFLVKPAVYTHEKVLGAKLLTLYPDNVVHNLPSHQSVITIFDSETGCLEAVLDGIAITDLRTAASTAVAFKYLIKPSNSKILTIIGTGHQAESHIQVLSSICTFKEIRICSRSNSDRAKEIAKKWKANAYDSIEEAAKDADVLVTVTKSSSVPVLLGKWVKTDALVCVVGAPQAHQRDVDDELMMSSFVIADTESESYASSGDVIQSKIKIAGEIGKVICGDLQVDWSKRRVYKSNGMALQDLIAGKIVVKTAKGKCNTK